MLRPIILAVIFALALAFMAKANPEKASADSHASTPVMTSSAGLFEGRLQADSATQVSLRRYCGDTITVAGESVSMTSTGIKLLTTDNLISSTGADSAGAMGTNTTYNLYLSNSKATFAPLDLRGSATAPTRYNGTYYLGVTGNALNWRFAGWARTDGSTEFADTVTSRHLINYYNRRDLSMFVCPGFTNGDNDTSYTNGQTSWGLIHASAILSFISNGEDPVHFNASVYIGSAVDGVYQAGLGLDSVTQPFGSHASLATGGSWQTSIEGDAVLSTGARTANILFVKTAGGSATIYSDWARNGAAADVPATYLVGTVKG